jgi:sugar phosphate isomerase/epimerase
MTFMKTKNNLLLWATLCVALSALSAPAAQKRGPAGTSPSFKGPVGLQLYSLRDSFAKDVPGTLDKAAALGFNYVELAGTYNLPPEKFRNLLREKRLKPVAGHFPFERLRDDPAGVAKEAKALGLQYAGCAWIPHRDPFDEKQCQEAIQVFNRAGKVLAKYGLRFFYHIHGYEFQPCGPGTLFDVMMTGTNPKYVSYEMDILWVHFPGQNPVALLQKYGARFELMHLKDLKKGVATGAHTGNTDVRNDVALGTGQIPLPEILKAARKAGVKYYFIEDESPSVEAQLPVSLRHLERMAW